MKTLLEIELFLRNEGLLDCVLSNNQVPNMTIDGISEFKNQEGGQKIAPIYQNSTPADVAWALNRAFIVQSFHMPQSYAETLKHVSHIVFVVKDIGHALYRLNQFI